MGTQNMLGPVKTHTGSSRLTYQPVKSCNRSERYASDLLPYRPAGKSEVCQQSNRLPEKTERSVYIDSSVLLPSPEWA